MTDLLSIAGINAVGGRSVGEIAERFLEQAALGASTKLPRDVRALIERFLAIKGDPDEAAADLRALNGDVGKALQPALDLFESRIGFFAAHGVDLKRVHFSTAFGRGFDYYTGFVFELTDPSRTGDPLVAGGRYDGLFTRLGSADADPCRRACRLDRAARHLRRRGMSAGARRAGKRPAAGKRGEFLRPRRAGADQAARGSAIIAARSPGSTASRSPIFPPPKSPRSWRRAPCTSASPARIWCAR